MARILEDLGFEVIAAIDADLQTMQRRLQEFRTAIRQGSVGVFYFVGHGVQYQGENYLIPVDAPLRVGLLGIGGMGFGFGMSRRLGCPTGLNSKQPSAAS